MIHQHVYGRHAHERCEEDQLARINNEADALAKGYLQYCVESRLETWCSRLGGTHWGLKHNEKPIVKSIDATLSTLILGEKSEEKLIQLKILNKKNRLENHSVGISEPDNRRKNLDLQI